MGDMNGQYILGDCMEYLPDYPDNHFDLAIVDPPYGIGENGNRFRGRKKDNHRKVVNHKVAFWDNERPNEIYFKELFRASVNQVIWGANYFIDYIKSPSMGWVFWDKRIGGDFSDGELAFTSFQKALRMYSYSYHGDTKGGHTRIHPTQKPVALYKWLLKNYAKEGDLILDTHVGSASSLIACEDMGFKYVGYEKDPDYYRDSMKRLNNHIAQLKIF